jgi:hypothetical protein
MQIFFAVTQSLEFVWNYRRITLLFAARAHPFSNLISCRILASTMVTDYNAVETWVLLA